MRSLKGRSYVHLSTKITISTNIATRVQRIPEMATTKSVQSAKNTLEGRYGQRCTARRVWNTFTWTVLRGGLTSRGRREEPRYWRACGVQTGSEWEVSSGQGNQSCRPLMDKANIYEKKYNFLRLKTILDGSTPNLNTPEVKDSKSPSSRFFTWKGF